MWIQKSKYWRGKKEINSYLNGFIEKFGQCIRRSAARGRAFTLRMWSVAVCRCDVVSSLRGKCRLQLGSVEANLHAKTLEDINERVRNRPEHLESTRHFHSTSVCNHEQPHLQVYLFFTRNSFC